MDWAGVWHLGKSRDPHTEKMSVSDNQNKKGWCKSSSFQGRYWDLRWRIIQKTREREETGSEVEAEGIKTSRAKYVSGNLCHQIGKCKNQHWQKWSMKGRVRHIAGVQACFSRDLTGGQQYSSRCLRTETERHNQGRTTFSWG